MDAGTLVLTKEQESAYRGFTDFIIDPRQDVLVITGFAGTGKSTLVKHIVDTLPSIFSTYELITQKALKLDVQLTATTNKAAEALSSIVGREVTTIQSFLGLVVRHDFDNGISALVRKHGAEEKNNYLLIIDECSQLDSSLLDYVFGMTAQCKIVFIGDPAQLTAVKTSSSPVFQRGYRTLALTEVVRQAAGSPIIELATAFRNTVNGSPFISGYAPDGMHVQVCGQNKFQQLICDEFDRPDWKYSDSRVLAWTNKIVIHYNHEIRKHIKGTPTLQEGDYAVCNSYTRNSNCALKTDQTVLINHMLKGVSLGVEGWLVTMNDTHSAFMPADPTAVTQVLKDLQKSPDPEKLQQVQREWIDLRAAYACTINKSQGSTYKKVFIDLNDIKKCNNGKLIARMMYVAISRASEQVIMTGDLV
jgi:energy-coupling factor transporter ATP-binding protein EcfA2